MAKLKLDLHDIYNAGQQIDRALEDLIDEAERAKALPIGFKLSPFDSDSLLEGLLERYRLRNFVHAYRHLDDEAFAVSVVNLFGTSEVR